MKILPINIYSAKNIQNSQNRIYNSNPIFTSQNDSFKINLFKISLSLRPNP